MAGEYDDRLQALDDKIETNRLSVQEQLRVVSDTMVRHGMSLTRLEEGQGRVETALDDQSKLLGEILRRLPPAGDE